MSRQKHQPNNPLSARIIAFVLFLPSLALLAFFGPLLIFSILAVWSAANCVNVALGGKPFGFKLSLKE